MIDLYTYGTSNGQKAAIILEECGLAYRRHVVDLKARQHLSAEFLALNPAGKIPVIVDHDGPDGRAITVSQSMAIALYLCEKADRLLPKNPGERAAVYQWMALDTTDLNAAFSGLFMLGILPAEPVTRAVEYFTQQAHRNLAVLEQRLGNSPYLAGASYTAADALAYATSVMATKLLAGGLESYPHLLRWMQVVGARDAVIRGMQ